jgi:hypothetical protein
MEKTMRSNGERGEGRLGSIVGLIVLVAVCLGAWNTVPAFIADYTFADKLHEIARLNRFQHNNDAIMGYMMKEAGKQRIDTYMHQEDCKITTRETSRTIECAYKRTIEILPGWKHTFSFTPSADQPLI